jgi:hypothetical protein
MIIAVGVIMGEKFDPKCHIGEVHGIYTIIDMLNEKDKYGHWIYKCVCNKCGFEKLSTYGEVSAPSKITTQCKHTRVDGSFITDYRWLNKRICKTFNQMIERCYNVDNKDYRWYGDKGVGICQEWRTNPQLFEEWALNNGYADNLTIDRIDANQDYCPENCRWIPLEENSRRAGIVTWIELDGKNMTGRQWADYLKIGTNTINKAIREHGLDKTKELILAMLKESPTTKHRKSHQTWFSVYGIQV